MHALATGLRGFQSSTLRVRVTRTEGDYVWVVTADLQDVGTPLVLDASQIQPIESDFVPVTMHRDGLVAFA